MSRCDWVYELGMLAERHGEDYGGDDSTTRAILYWHTFSEPDDEPVPITPERTAESRARMIVVLEKELAT